MTNKQYYLKKAFSLLELSISLVIISLIISISVTSINNYLNSAKLNATNNKIVAINNAIGNFIKINNRLPCPTNATLSEADANFGAEYCTGNLSVDLTGSLPTSFSGTSNIVIAGAVPFKALNIPILYTKDGYNNRFTYVVTKALTDSSSSFATTNMGLIKIQDRTNNYILDNAALLILSHGAKGYGAWNSFGSRNSASSNSNEIQNSHVGATWDAIFVINHTPFNGFDDVGIYQTKSQILDQARIAIYNQACISAQNIIKNNTSYYCTNPTRQFPASPMCEFILGNFSEQLNRWCK